MELTKVSNEPATLRDVRNLEAMMLAGFEACYEILGTLMAHQVTDKALTGAEADEVIEKYRQLFQQIMDKKRAEYFLQSE